MDCEDADGSIHPQAAANEPELCTYDLDGDGWGDHLYAGHDCNDGDRSVVPVVETCNDVDDDCDGAVDNIDTDADGVTLCDGDCDDTNAAVRPGMTEVCDGLDNDCNESTNEEVDSDGDGYSLCDGDCDDTHDSAYPGGIEEDVADCDTVDNDCDGMVDEVLECNSCTDTTYLGTTYRACEYLRTQSEAAEVCGSYGGALAEPNTLPEERYIASIVPGEAWVGVGINPGGVVVSLSGATTVALPSTVWYGSSVPLEEFIQNCDELLTVPTGGRWVSRVRTADEYPVPVSALGTAAYSTGDAYTIQSNCYGFTAGAFVCEIPVP